MNVTKGRLQNVYMKMNIKQTWQSMLFPQIIFPNLPNKLTFKKCCRAYIKKLHESLRENPHKEGKW